MKKTKRLTYEEKLLACQLYEQGKGSYESIANQFRTSTSGFKKLYFKYKHFGNESLKLQRNNKSYTKEFKETVISAYKNGEGSYNELATIFGISNAPLITRWVLGYNNIKTTHSGSGGEDIMARKTTLDERIEIIDYLIKSELDYHGTSKHFNVSYQQVYIWYKKYQSFGVEGLHDKRGHKKQSSEISELEQLRRENERLKKELYLSEAAKEIFKKKQELEEKAHLTRLETKKYMKQ